jgi:hypothetical protein
MGEIRLNIPDSLHEDIKELAKDNDVRLNEEATALLLWAVDLVKKDRERALLNQKNRVLSDGRSFHPNGEPEGT